MLFCWKFMLCTYEVFDILVLIGVSLISRFIVEIFILDILWSFGRYDKWCDWQKFGIYVKCLTWTGTSIKNYVVVIFSKKNFRVWSLYKYIHVSCCINDKKYGDVDIFCGSDRSKNEMSSWHDVFLLSCKWLEFSGRILNVL